MGFAQLVVGPPGSGKTTYCNGMKQFLDGIGRKCAVVNLDPANENTFDGVQIDVRDLCDLNVVMEELNLGPNGGLLYCMEYLVQNKNWLHDRIKEIGDDVYLLFDCPGQIELFTHHETLKDLCDTISNEWNYRMAAVHLIDAHHCSDPSKFMSALMVSLSTMIRLELPHVNILSKIDLVEQYGKLGFDISYYTDVQDLRYLIDGMENKEGKSTKFTKLNQGTAYILFADVVEEFSLVSFLTLNIEDKKSVYNVCKYVDKCNGYVFGACEVDNRSIMDLASGDVQWDHDRFDEGRQYMQDDDEVSEDDDQ
ncbi:GPN-loop GTPase [Acrasis kona]|uniref:GPN-loop GTPase 2 n=1 Tax=Acrasis kona TaxID=1008807 RepID=A0AAW2ZI43_9EUKA